MVSLTGHVSHYTEEMAAERTARRVKGVHAIAEGIEVRCLGETSDEEIAQTCAQHYAKPSKSLPGRLPACSGSTTA